MQIPSASDDDVALVYIRLVRKESSDAAAVLEQIHRLSGAPAALKAALVITLLKQEIQHDHSLLDIDRYTYLLKDYPEAIPLLGVAILRCLEHWVVSEIDQQKWETWQRSLTPQSQILRAPFENLIDRIRQSSPITAVKLEQIYKNYGVTAGGYAASALIWVGASIEKFGYALHDELTEQRLQGFTYFEYVSADQQAVDQFIDMLKAYRIERQPTSSSTFRAEHDALYADNEKPGI